MLEIWVFTWNWSICFWHLSFCSWNLTILLHIRLFWLKFGLTFEYYSYLYLAVWWMFLKFNNFNNFYTLKNLIALSSGNMNKRSHVRAVSGGKQIITYEHLFITLNYMGLLGSYICREKANFSLSPPRGETPWSRTKASREISSCRSYACWLGCLFCILMGPLLRDTDRLRSKTSTWCRQGARIPLIVNSRSMATLRIPRAESWCKSLRRWCLKRTQKGRLAPWTSDECWKGTLK